MVSLQLEVLAHLLQPNQHLVWASQRLHLPLVVLALMPLQLLAKLPLHLHQRTTCPKQQPLLALDLVLSKQLGQLQPLVGNRVLELPLLLALSSKQLLQHFHSLPNQLLQHQHQTLSPLALHQLLLLVNPH